MTLATSTNQQLIQQNLKYLHLDYYYGHLWVNLFNFCLDYEVSLHDHGQICYFELELD